MRINFNTTQYEFSHGRKPRGYGGWAFVVTEGSPEPVWAPGSMTFADAKRWVTAHVRSVAPADFPVVHVEVCT